jgi:hypothetical protein
MQTKVLALVALLLLISNSWAGIPQNTSSTTTSSPQAATLLAQAAKLLTGPGAVSDVTLTGTVESIAGSDDETGAATYKAVNGAHRLDLTFRNGTRSEIVSTANGIPSGSWIGLDGTSHSIANHNLMSDAGWFPAFTLGNLISSSNIVLVYVGPETRSGTSVIHLSGSKAFPNLSSNSAPLRQHLTQVDIYLDSTTLLPVSYLFNLHPDDNALQDIPVELQYSNYQPVQGTQIPFHIQEFVNGSLTVDFQVQNVLLNTGITAVQISAQ